jgi:hypothetical protein
MIDADEDVFAIKQGDLEPPLEIDVSGSRGDLTAVTDWRVIGSQNGIVVFDDSDATFALGASNSEGTVTHTWVAGETDALGPMDIEVKAIWPGDRTQTFPPKHFSKVWIFATLA